jgi:hypothetical protein
MLLAFNNDKRDVVKKKMVGSIRYLNTDTGMFRI